MSGTELRLCYAVSSTEIGAGAEFATRCPVLRHSVCYAMSGTELRLCYAMSGTEIGAGAEFIGL
eukprot:206939-Rhodomonas_salina.1